MISLTPFCINSFASIGIGGNKVNIKKLDFYVTKLYNILQEHKNEVIDKLKKKWKYEGKNTNSFYIDNSTVKANNIYSQEYSENYSLF